MQGEGKKSARRFDGNSDRLKCSNPKHLLQNLLSLTQRNLRRRAARRRLRLVFHAWLDLRWIYSIWGPFVPPCTSKTSRHLLSASVLGGGLRAKADEAQICVRPLTAQHLQTGQSARSSGCTHAHAHAHTLPNTHIDRRVVWRLSGYKQAVNTSSVCARVCASVCVSAACAFVLSPSITLRLPDVSDGGTRACPRADNKPIIR